MVSCQQEKLLPITIFSYKIAGNGLLEGSLITDGSNYQINYGDTSPLEIGSATMNVPIILKHKYNKKGTFNIIVTTTNKNVTTTQNKEVVINTIAYLPTADFKYSLGENGIININFDINYGDIYEMDFGNGQIIKDTLKNYDLSKSFSLSTKYQYKNNGNYKVKLLISNVEGKAITEQIVSITNIAVAPIPDFSYEILSNGEIRLKNLSQNATSYKWFIRHYNNSNSYDFYISTKEDINVFIDLVGYYLITLSSENGDIKRNISKLVNIKSAKNQMEFSGYYNGQKINGSLESNQLFYRYGFGSSSGALGTNFGLFQSINQITNNNDSLDLLPADYQLIKQFLFFFL